MACICNNMPMPSYYPSLPCQHGKHVCGIPMYVCVFCYNLYYSTISTFFFYCMLPSLAFIWLDIVMTVKPHQCWWWWWRWLAVFPEEYYMKTTFYLLLLEMMILLFLYQCTWWQWWLPARWCCDIIRYYYPTVIIVAGVVIGNWFWPLEGWFMAYAFWWWVLLFTYDGIVRPSYYYYSIEPYLVLLLLSDHSASVLLLTLIYMYCTSDWYIDYWPILHNIVGLDTWWLTTRIPTCYCCVIDTIDHCFASLMTYPLTIDDYDELPYCLFSI